MKKLDILPIGLYEENVYLLHEDGHVLIIDPGCKAKEIQKYINDEVVDGIILTHGHEDHALGVDDLVDIYHCPIYMHEDEIPLVNQSYANDLPYFEVIYNTITPIKEDETIGQFNLHILHTPGHTAGSICIQYKEYLFTGDTLFAGSIGRCDLYSGDEATMMESLKIFKSLDHSLQIYPGHGPSSTIGFELEHNSYLI